MSVCGKYVATFANASHALPEGMHMNADYPLMLPLVVRVTRKEVVLRGRDGEVTARIIRRKGREWCAIAQSSSFEKLFNRAPQRFRFHPFKDERTAAPGLAEG